MASITDIVRETAGDVREALFTRALTRTPPDAAMEHINHATKVVSRKIGRGMLAVAASGFGKGVIITALIAIAALGLYGGVLGSEVSTFGNGVVSGVLHAIGFIGNWPGLTLLAAGGAVGAVAEARGKQNEITAEIAAEQAQNFELARQLGRSKDIDLSKNIALATPLPAPVSLNSEGSIADTIPECDHCARELERRAQAQQQILEGRM